MCSDFSLNYDTTVLFNFVLKIYCYFIFKAYQVCSTVIVIDPPTRRAANYRKYRSLAHPLDWLSRLDCSTTERVPMPKRAVFKRSRRELSLVHILLVVEQSSLERQSRGCAKTPILAVCCAVHALKLCLAAETRTYVRHYKPCPVLSPPPPKVSDAMNTAGTHAHTHY